MTGQKLYLPWWCMGKSTNLLFCMAKVTKKKEIHHYWRINFWLHENALFSIIPLVIFLVVFELLVVDESPFIKEVLQPRLIEVFIGNEDCSV